MDIVRNFKIKQIIKEVDTIKVLLEVGGLEREVSAQDLLFANDIELDAKQNPAREVFWESLANECKFLLLDQELKIDEYIAYHKQFLKWYLKGKSEKDTIEGRNEAFYIVFSSNTTELECRTAAIFAYRGYTEERRLPLSHDEWLLLLRWADTGGEIAVRNNEFNEFYQRMFQARRQGIFYDRLIIERNQLEEARNIIVSIADGMKQKGILLASLLSGKKSYITKKEDLIEKILEKEVNYENKF